MDSRIKFIENTWRCSIASLPGKILGPNRQVAAVTNGAKIYIRKKHLNNEVLKRHEATHGYQYLDFLDDCGKPWLAKLRFRKIYLGDYFHGLFRTFNHSLAYFNIRFEQEAYAKQHNVSYLANRPKHAWERYKLDQFTKEDLK